MTSSKPSQQEIDAMCESICDDLEQISALQARVLRLVYRDKLNKLQIAHVCKIQAHRIDAEIQGALRNVVDMMTQSALSQWSTPEQARHPKPGESANAAPEVEVDQLEGEAGPDEDANEAKPKSKAKRAKNTRQKR